MQEASIRHSTATASVHHSHSLLYTQLQPPPLQPPPPPPPPPQQQQQQQPPRPRVLSILSSLLSQVVATNEQRLHLHEHQQQEQQEQQQQEGQDGYGGGGGSSKMSTPYKLTVFHGLRAPSISIQKYVERIFKYASCSPSCFVVAYAYMDRFIQRHPDVPITSLNVHRLLITSVMVAAKFLDDSYFNNAHYAKVGGVTTQEMNRLELEFLFRLDFNLQVTVAVFEGYCTQLERQVSYNRVERPLLPQLGCCARGTGCCNNHQQQHLRCQFRVT